jgi:PIN domain
MAYKPAIAVYDACVLYPFHLRNLLVQCGADRLVDARWTDAIHDEWIHNLAANTQNLSIQRLTETRDLMKRVLPTADVTGYEKHIPQLALPDPGDRHVLAAAIAGRASNIVTWNLADFPAKALAPHHVSAQNPDDFLMDLYAAAPDAVIAVAENARKNLKKTAPTVTEFIHALERQKLTRFATLLRDHDKKL